MAQDSPSLVYITAVGSSVGVGLGSCSGSQPGLTMAWYFGLFATSQIALLMFLERAALSLSRLVSLLRSAALHGFLPGVSCRELAHECGSERGQIFHHGHLQYGFFQSLYDNVCGSALLRTLCTGFTECALFEAFCSRGVGCLAGRKATPERFHASLARLHDISRKGTLQGAASGHQDYASQRVRRVKSSRRTFLHANLIIIIFMHVTILYWVLMMFSSASGS